MTTPALPIHDDDIRFRIAQFLADHASDDETGYHWSEFIGDARDLIAVLAERGYTIASSAPTDAALGQGEG